MEKLEYRGEESFDEVLAMPEMGVCGDDEGKVVGVSTRCLVRGCIIDKLESVGGRTSLLISKNPCYRSRTI